MPKHPKKTKKNQNKKNNTTNYSKEFPIEILDQICSYLGVDEIIYLIDPLDDPKHPQNIQRLQAACTQYVFSSGFLTEDLLKQLQPWQINELILNKNIPKEADIKLHLYMNSNIINKIHYILEHPDSDFDSSSDEDSSSDSSNDKSLKSKIFDYLN